MSRNTDSVLAHYGLGNGEGVATGAAPAGGAGLSDWAVPWSDMMMILCVLFLVLYVYASTHRNVTVLFRPGVAGVADPTADPVDRVLNRLEDREMFLRVADGREVLFRSEASGVSAVREVGGVIRVTLRGDVFFEPGQDRLRPQALAYLDEVAGILRLHTGLVHILGYADEAEGGAAAGFDLSVRRAANVSRHFLDIQGVDPRRLLVSGHGTFRPESPSGTPGASQRNRRVEILLLNEK